MDALIGLYLDVLRVERGLSENTIAAYARDLSRLAAWCEQQSLVEATAIDRHALEEFVLYLYEQELSPRSVARSVSSVRGFVRFLVADGRREDDPAARLSSPRFPHKLPHVLRVDEVEALLAAPGVDSPRALRDTAMIELLYSSGLRVSELCGLRRNALRRDPATVIVRGKGDKERVVPVGPAAEQAVRAFLEQGWDALDKGRSSPFLFLGRGGKALTRQAFWKLVKRHAGADPQRALCLLDGVEVGQLGQAHQVLGAVQVVLEVHEQIGAASDVHRGGQVDPQPHGLGGGGRLVDLEGGHPEHHATSLSRAWSAASTRSGVKGISRSRTPVACQIALAMAGIGGCSGPSPASLAP